MAFLIQMVTVLINRSIKSDYISFNSKETILSNFKGHADNILRNNVLVILYIVHVIHTVHLCD